MSWENELARSRNGNPLQYSRMKNSKARGVWRAWRATVHAQPQSGGREGEGEKGSSKLDLTLQRDITISAQCLYIVNDEQACVLVVWYHLCPGETRISRKKIMHMCLAKGSGSRTSSVCF